MVVNLLTVLPSIQYIGSNLPNSDAIIGTQYTAVSVQMHNYCARCISNLFFIVVSVESHVYFPKQFVQSFYKCFYFLFCS